MSITITFDGELAEQQVQRLVYLASRDLCRVVGAQVLAEEKLERRDELGGRVRKQAQKTIASTPKQAEVLEEAMSALQAGLKAAQKRWERIGGG